jgi:NADH-quinone oxidoreductase subunit L
MGGLKNSLPRTYWTFLAACLALAALWPFSGFFSKDLILWEAYASPYGGLWLWLLGLVTAGISSFYIFRLFFQVFHGVPERALASEPEAELSLAAHHHHAHESPPIMTWPLIVLAVLSLAGGWIGSHALFGETDLWSRFISPAFALAAIPDVEAVAHSATTEHLFMALSLIVSLAGIALAYLLYQLRPGLAAGLQERFDGLYKLLLNKYYVDELYRVLFVRPLLWLSTEFFWKAMDVSAVDGSMRRVARGVARFGDAFRRMQSGNVRSYAGWVTLGAILLMGFLVGWVS